MIDEKHLKNVEYFNYLGIKITNYARCTPYIKTGIAVAKAGFNQKKLYTSKFDLNFGRI